MIMQKFVSVRITLGDMMEKCNTDSPYFHAQFEADCSTVESNLLSLEEKLISLLDTLSEKRRPDLHVRNLDDVSRFLLYVAIRSAFIHDHADVQIFPYLPETEYWKNLCAYLQYNYLKYRKYCSQNGINLWESILEYEAALSPDD